MNPWRPLIVVVANFVVGYMVSQGFVDSSQKNEVAELIAEIAGYGIIFVTSVATLIHTFKRPHQPQLKQPIVEQIVKTDVQTKPIFTEQSPVEASLPSGTPPITNL